jgi:hypothetical protein
VSRRSARVDRDYGGRVVHVPGIGTVEVRTDEDGKVEAFVNRVLSQDEQLRLEAWLRHEWTRRTN